MLYCVDTSGWLDGWERYYPPDVFPSLWTKVEGLIESGEIITSEEVYIELERKADDIHAWVMKRKQMLVPLTENIQERAGVLLAEFPRLVDTTANRGRADPFVIATAQELGAVVVTGERQTGKLDRPRIPDVCLEKSIRCIKFLDLIREKGITF